MGLVCKAGGGRGVGEGGGGKGEKGISMMGERWGVGRAGDYSWNCLGVGSGSKPAIDLQLTGYHSIRSGLYWLDHSCSVIRAPVQRSAMPCQALHSAISSAWEQQQPPK